VDTQAPTKFPVPGEVGSWDGNTHTPGNGSAPRPGVVAGESLGHEFAGMDIVSGPEDIDYDAAAPKKISAAQLNRWAEEHPHAEATLWRYRLHQTSINMGGDPIYAVVKIINLTDRTLIGILPMDVRRAVERLFFAGENPARNKQKGNMQRMEEGLQRVKQIGYVYGCAGFVDPQLVMTPQDVKDPEKQAWVGSIALHDLTEFSRICEGDEALAARRLEPFLEQSDPAV
jgi:hypothetical protein